MSAYGVVPTNAKAYFPGFLPSIIPNCTIWLDASDESTITLSGSNVSAWRSKGTNTNSTQQTQQPTGTTRPLPTYGSTFINGLRTVRFAGATDATNPTNGTNGQSLEFTTSFSNQAKACFAVMKVLNSEVELNATYTAQYYNIFQRYSTGYYGFSYFTASGSPNTYNYQVGINATKVMINALNPTSIYNVPTVVCIFNSSVAGNNIVSSNGSTLSRSPDLQTGITGNNYTLTSALYRIHTNNYPVGYELGELIIYDGTLTTLQRQQIEGYLAWKWGAQGRFPTSHPYKYQPPWSRYFIPTDLSGCQIWLDAADNSAMTRSGSTLTQIKDKSTNSFTLTPSGFTFQNNFNGTYPCFYNATRATSSSLGVTPTSFNLTQPITTFFVGCKITSTNFYDGYIFDSASTSRLTQYGAEYTLYAGAGLNGATTTTYVNVNVVCCGIFNTTASQLFLNGTQIGSTGNIGTGATTNGVRFGNNVNSNDSWVGNYCEFIVYNRVLTTIERQQVEGYLAWKWGLSTPLPSTHIFKRYYTLTNLFNNPLQFSDVILWLDASDITGINFQPSLGAAISIWTDKSGNGKNATQATSARQPIFTYDGNFPAIQFSSASSQYLIGVPILTSTNYGIFIVTRTTNTSSNQSCIDIVKQVTSPSTYLTMYPYNTGSTGSYYDINYSASISATTKKTASSTTATSRTIMSICDNSALATSPSICFQNGNTLSNTFIGGSSNISTDVFGYTIGAYYGTGSSTYLGFLDGYVYEVIVMLHQPTTYERQMIEGYLAWKWGIQNSLPSTHPFYRVKP